MVFVPKGKNAESYKDIAKEEIDSLTQNAEELRVVYKEYSGREQFYYLNSNREEAIDGLSRVTNPIVIYQANEAVALNGSYIETGTDNGEVIYEMCIRDRPLINPYNERKGMTRCTVKEIQEAIREDCRSQHDMDSTDIDRVMQTLPFAQDEPFTEVRPQKPLFWFYARKFEKC